MAGSRSPSGVLLVGSIPCSTAEETFTTVAPALKGKIHSIPDGEVGERNHYIFWQRDRFPAESRWKLPVCDGVDLPADHPGFTKDSVPPTGYGAAAVESYAKFAELQKAGTIIPQDVRFQVSLPMPQDCIQLYVRNEFHDSVGALYEQRVREDVELITKSIPHDKLAVQWDIAILPTAMEYEKGRAGRLPAEWFTPPIKPVKEGFLQKLKPFAEMVPEQASLGLHICYGDFDHTHHIEPEDMAVLVDIANSAVRTISRPVSWIHMPVPKQREDAEYFAALKNLDIGSTKLYIGLVHPNDEEGTKRRIAKAKEVVSDFGVATECGMGRYTSDELQSLLQIYNNHTGPQLN